MPARLRPTAPIASDAVLVGDPGRALMLAQVLIEEPKMSNHARGLWGYSGVTSGGRELTIQSTGMGGPSAAIVLADLAELGLRRAIRVGTCTALNDGLALGALLWVSAAIAWRDGAPAAGGTVEPDAELASRLRAALGEGTREAVIASLDVLHRGDRPAIDQADAADMQTAALLAHGRELGVALGAVLVVAEAGGNTLDDSAAEDAAKRAGEAASLALSNPQV